MSYAEIRSIAEKFVGDPWMEAVAVPRPAHARQPAHQHKVKGYVSLGRSQVAKARDREFVDKRLSYELLSKQIGFRQIDDLIAPTAQHGLGHVQAKAYCLLQFNGRRHRQLLPGGNDVN